MGTWERKSETFWMYHLPGEALIYGYVVRRLPAVPSAMAWDALVASPRGKEDLPVRSGVSLDEAKGAIERAADERRP